MKLKPIISNQTLNTASYIADLAKVESRNDRIGVDS